MASTSIGRRTFVKGTASALALASLPRMSFGATPVIRLEWQAFKATPHYASYLTAIRTMKSITDSTKATSWKYWANVHANYCPHDVAYFMAWHRGYIYYFEQQLKSSSGDTGVTLPYWDYYTYPTIPSEFTDTASGNPLYVSRVNSNVYQALDLSPFGSRIVNFQRGTSSAFETMCENAPHDPVHDIIGGPMADIATAATDPLFYLHHCNIDRLWNAWSLRPTSKVPVASNSYWSGTFTYARSLTMARSLTRTTAQLGYDYANDTTPAVLPPQAQQGRIIRVQAQVSAIRGLPQLATFTTTPGRSISATRRALGGVKGIALGETSLSASIPLQASNATALKDVLSSSPAIGLSATQVAPSVANKFQYVKLVLDDVNMPSSAAGGGFFYNVYVNLPATGDVDAVRSDHFVGTLGAFQISTARYHGMNMIEYDVTDLLARLGITNPNQIVVSFVRISALNHPKGKAVSIGEARVELGTDAP
ncbi:tyrosinase family protein [Caballeronia sp. Lep1P3]|uniref:tyrosinase family protein n=1 Tax=Caballeronia sp. Lep1P3 TaxID=2878150 RepID=UPI001FD10DA2|nr:tyrosinase family protein [Caballeronia sp. Lep1P3]